MSIIIDPPIASLYEAMERAMLRHRETGALADWQSFLLKKGRYQRVLILQARERAGE